MGWSGHTRCDIIRRAPKSYRIFYLHILPESQVGFAVIKFCDGFTKETELNPRTFKGNQFETREGTHEAKFIWRDALAGLIFIEKHRGDDGPVLQIELNGELCYVVKCKEWWPDEPGRFRMGDTSADVRTQPTRSVREQVEVSYPGQVWAKMIQEASELSQDNPLLALQSLLPFLTGGKQRP